MERLEESLGLQLPVAVLLAGMERTLSMEAARGPVIPAASQAGGGGAWAAHTGPSCIVWLASQVPLPCASAVSLV